MAKKIPYHLDELKLADLKIQPKCTEALMEMLISKSFIRKLRLSNLN
jgi:hypothetical protein